MSRAKKVLLVGGVAVLVLAMAAMNSEKNESAKSPADAMRT